MQRHSGRSEWKIFPLNRYTCRLCWLDLDLKIFQLFFHRFFSRRNEKEIAKASKVDKRKEQDDDVTSGSEAADHKGEIEQDSDKDASDAENNTVEEDSDAEEAEIWKVRIFLLLLHPSA